MVTAASGVKVCACGNRFPVEFNARGQMTSRKLCDSCRRKRVGYHGNALIRAAAPLYAVTPQCVDCTAYAGPGFLAKSLDASGRCPNCARVAAAKEEKRLRRRAGQWRQGGLWFGRSPFEENQMDGLRITQLTERAERTTITAEHTRLDLWIQQRLADLEKQRAAKVAQRAAIDAEIETLDAEGRRLTAALNAYQAPPVAPKTKRPRSAPAHKRGEMAALLLEWARSHEGRVSIPEVAGHASVSEKAVRLALGRIGAQRVEVGVYVLPVHELSPGAANG